MISFVKNLKRSEKVAPVRTSPPGKHFRLTFPEEVVPGIMGTGRISTNSSGRRPLVINGWVFICL